MRDKAIPQYLFYFWSYLLSIWNQTSALLTPVFLRFPDAMLRSRALRTRVEGSRWILVMMCIRDPQTGFVRPPDRCLPYDAYPPVSQFHIFNSRTSRWRMTDDMTSLYRFCHMEKLQLSLNLDSSVFCRSLNSNPYVTNKIQHIEFTVAMYPFFP